MGRKTVQIDAAAWQTYPDAVEGVTPAVHNAMACQVGAIADFCALPQSYLTYRAPSGDQPARGEWAVHTVNEGTGAAAVRASLVGDGLATWLRTGRPAPVGFQRGEFNPASLTPEERARIAAIPADARRYAWAMVDVLRAMESDARQPDVARRRAGITLLGVVVVVGIVAAVVIAIGVAVNVAVNQATRRERLLALGGATNFTNRLAVFRATGIMPPPSEEEVAMAGMIGTRAARAEAEGTSAPDWSTQLQRAASATVKLVYAGAVALVLYMVTKDRS